MKTNLTFLKSKSTNAALKPVIAFVPGGPGLSSKSLIGCEVLSRSFDLILIDPPGTGGGAEPEFQNFESLLASFEFELKKVERPIILAGHSFGGYQAAHLIAKQKLNYAGLICLAAPLTKKTFEIISTEYDSHKTPLLAEAEAKWSENKSLENMRNWFLSYESLWFSKKNLATGKKLIAQDRMSLNAFLRIEPDFSDEKHFLSILRTLAVPKILIAGEQDLLIPAKCLKADAEAAGLDFVILKNSAHFMNLDEPEAIAALVENKFIDSKKGVRL